MRSRIALAAVMLPLLAALPASASILPARSADCLRVATVQTWMLLATGLAMVGGYTVIRRRAEIG